MTPKRIILVRHGRSTANDDPASAVVFENLTQQRVNMSLAELDTVGWREALADDSQVCFYADMITKYMIKRHPSNAQVKEIRTSYEHIFGDEKQE